MGAAGGLVSVSLQFVCDGKEDEQMCRHSSTCLLILAESKRKNLEYICY